MQDMQRPPAAQIAARLRHIKNGKALTLNQFRNNRPETWIAEMNTDISVLEWAAIGYDKLAQKEVQDERGRQEENS